LAPYTFTYDAFGRPLTVNDGVSRKATFGYDADGRVTSISFNDGSITVGYTYDGSGNLIQRTDGSGTTTYTYDLANRLLTRANTAGGKTLTYTYDPVGNLTSVSDGRGVTSYTYDSRNLLSSNGPLYTFSYDADGRRTATYFNTVTGNTTWAARTTTAYDKSGRISRITTALNSSPATLVFDTSYCYSPFVSGQSCPTGSSSTDKALLQYATDNVTGKVSVYSYDKGNRLTAAPGGTTYSYNAAEQMTAEQMTQSTVNGTTSAHVYAGTDERELTSAGSNQFVWGRNDQYGQPWLQSFNTGGQSQVYVDRDGFGTPLGLHTGGNDFHLVLDNLGSVVAVVNTAGTVVARYTYDPYGSTVTADESGLSRPNIVRYIGGALDQTTGLTKLGQRYYNPALGAFTQQDADQLLANPQNGNLYAYAADSPSTFIDPTGRDLCQYRPLMCGITSWEEPIAGGPVLQSGFVI